jgi:hypothetical protein
MYRWMSKEPAEIFERAAEDGFIDQLKHHSVVSQYGQLSGSLKLDGSEVRKHFEHILHNQVFTSMPFSELSLLMLLNRF